MCLDRQETLATLSLGDPSNPTTVRLANYPNPVQMYTCSFHLFTHSPVATHRVRPVAPHHSSRVIYLPKNCTSIHHHSRLAASYSALCYLFEFLKGCVQCSRLPLDHRAKVSSFLLLLVVVVDAPARPEQTTRIHRRQRCT